LFPRERSHDPMRTSVSDPVRSSDAADDPLWTPGEVAAALRVDPKTVGRWASEGLIDSIRTPGGHRRFRDSTVKALLGGAR
jgi:excisionase family DNA binding protein